MAELLEDGAGNQSRDLQVGLQGGGERFGVKDVVERGGKFLSRCGGCTRWGSKE